ncbi:helix-turn-helix domain-containing protein [Natronincola ferrireducens]|uniref:Homeodomain-like domain-containing protein n=1 Tax=Natronincola ferrireducens TaxID=393762 RepID=A0A1G9H8Q1_9FIRM|nr:helix-turn-helix domain-containing protein [Natronincola ferrireducens]SDL09310.1 Homeodomain-like domain-containing protein [Natronincola ferrireducens]
MDDLNYNYMALLEAILSPEEVLPDLILYKYGLLELSPKELKELEAMEMKRLYKQKWTYREIAKRFHMSDSGVYRRMKRFGGQGIE